MYNYKPTESHDGSHFFIKTSNEIIVRASLFVPEEGEYGSDYLTENIRFLIIKNFTIGAKLTQSEGIESCETISKIVYDYLAYHSKIVKIEVKQKCGKDIHIQRFLMNRPEDVKGFIVQNEEASIYYLFNVNKVDGVDLLYSLNEEYKN